VPAGEGFIQAFVQDITDRKIAEDALRMNEARLRSLVGILQYPAETIQEFLDYTLEEIIRFTDSHYGFIYYVYQERQELELCSWSKDVMAECAVAERLTVRHLDSTGLWGEAARSRRPFILNGIGPDTLGSKGYPAGHVELTRFMTIPVQNNGRVVAVVGVANKDTDYDETDVLQLTVLMDAVWKYVVTRQSEIELEQERARAQMYLETVEAMIVALDRDGTITAINRKGCQILGYREDELLGRNWFTTCIQQPEGKNLLLPLFIKLIAGNNSTEYFENCVQTKEGDLKLIAWHNALLRDEHGRVIGTLSAGEDITERRKIEVEKANLEGQLRQSQKMEAIGQLAGGIAHDFNNILQVILGYTTLLEFGIPDDQKENLQEIRSATERAAELTSGLLSYSRKQVLKLEAFELNNLLAGIKKFIQRVLGEDIELCLEYSPIPLFAVIDQVHLQQVFVNLASNARDAMPSGGKLTIRLEQKAGTTGLPTDEQSQLLGPQALITVSDTGIGISSDNLSKIFEPFYTTKVEGSGTGLGLSIVQGIISQLNGYITCSSEIGAGTTYHLYLPLSGQPAPEATVSVETVEQTGPASTILLVEDDPEVRKVNHNLLASRGYRVMTAANGAEAIRIYTMTPHIDLVILDAIMPGLNGGETLAQLREINPDIRFLIVSGYPRDVISGRMALPPDVEFMSKPVRPQQLFDAVTNLIAEEIRYGAATSQ
jgi:PAS domain S-box-containing protein